MSNLWLTVEVAPGAVLERTCDDAVALAERVGVTVWFNFNGVKCLARPGDDPKKIEWSWDEALKSGRSRECIASDDGKRPNA